MHSIENWVFRIQSRQRNATRLRNLLALFDVNTVSKFVEYWLFQLRFCLLKKKQGILKSWDFHVLDNYNMYSEQT